MALFRRFRTPCRDSTCDSGPRAAGRDDELRRAFADRQQWQLHVRSGAPGDRDASPARRFSPTDNDRERHPEDGARRDAYDGRSIRRRFGIPACGGRCGPSRLVSQAEPFDRRCKRMRNGNLLYIDFSDAVEIDMLGNVVQRWRTSMSALPPGEATEVRANPFHHELTELPWGNLLALSHEIRRLENYPTSETDTAPSDQRATGAMPIRRPMTRRMIPSSCPCGIRMP